MHLAPLSDEAMRKLLTGVAGGLSDFIAEEIVERAEGIPLYSVEMLRMLIDRGYLVRDDPGHRLVAAPDRMEVPDTLHSLVAARLDALEPAERALLRDAAVLGKTFTRHRRSPPSSSTRQADAWRRSPSVQGKRRADGPTSLILGPR
jgi:predicted ATPase